LEISRRDRMDHRKAECEGVRYIEFTQSFPVMGFGIDGFDSAVFLKP
jgi:hypothetical protein